MSATSIGLGLAALAAVALAVQSLAVRLGTRTRTVTDVVAVIFAINLAVLVPATAVVYGGDLGLTPTATAAFAAGGILGSLLARYALFVGIERLGASRAEPLKSTFPLVAVIGAVVWLRESLTPSLVAGVALLVGGAVAVSWDARASSATAAGRRALADLRFPLAAALLLGIDPVFTAVGLGAGTPSVVGVTVRVLAAAAAFGLYLAWRRLRGGRRLRVGRNRWLVLAGLANTLYLGAYLAALDRAPVSVVAPILGASPLLVLVGSALFVQSEERVTPRLGAAVAVLVAGVVLVLRG
ncbi:EamA family transporter [Halomicrobium salinisoli]|uniref:EamA family transporter n=1 Tax=Halomicrobium salinisoli TaxID=2878391 RepID=UPI001CF060BA|nr:EamA family transporter [Halomicrobium salinisoli]